MGLSLPRHGPEQGISLGRRRPGGNLRSLPTSGVQLGLVERQGPDSKGAFVRTDARRRKSRRGCEGVLLLSRQYSDTFLHEVSLQIPAGEVSVWVAAGRKPEAWRARIRI